MLPPRIFKINPRVAPYGGRLLEAKEVTGSTVSGWVRLGGWRGFATAVRTYAITEVTELQPKGVDRSGEAGELRF